MSLNARLAAAVVFMSMLWAGTLAAAQGPAPRTTSPMTSGATAPIPATRSSTPAASAATASAEPLTGLDVATVKARLGQPAVERAEGAGAFWTYRLPNCALFVYFSDAGRGLRVSGVSTGPRHHGEVAPETEACLADASAEASGPNGAAPP